MKRQAFPEKDSTVPSVPATLDYFDAMLYGGKCLEFYSFEVDETAPVSLVIPAGAKMCVLVAEAGGSPATSNTVAGMAVVANTVWIPFVIKPCELKDELPPDPPLPVAGATT